MVKEYIRYCDCCKKEIKNLYDFGVTTLYNRIRIGRGGRFHDYQDKSILNLVKHEEPVDYDPYGSGWKQDKDAEFSFCSPKCLMEFIEKLYKDTYNSSLERIKKEKKEGFDVTFENFKKNYGEKISFFKKIQTKFSKNIFLEEAIKEADELIKEIKKKKQEVSNSSQA